MRKFRIIIFTFFLLALAFISNLNVNAESMEVSIENGAKVRTDDKIAIQFSAKVSGKYDECGFIYAKGLVNDFDTNDVVTKKVEPLSNGNIYLSFTNLTKDNLEDVYSVVAYVKNGSSIVKTNIVSRSIMNVCENLGKGFANYVDNILALKKEEESKYKLADVTFLPNGGTFTESGNTENLVLTLSDPTTFPQINKEGYKLVGWRNMSENKVYDTFPGNEKVGAKIKYLAVWEQLPTASKLIAEYIPDEVFDLIEVPTTFEGSQLKWSVEDNSYIKYSNGKLICDLGNQKHQSEDVKILLEYNGTKAQKIIRIAAIELKDLTGKNPFAIYFAVGSLNNYTNYPGHSVNNLFSEEVKNKLDIVYYAFGYPTQDGDVTLSKPSSYSQIKNQLNNLRKNGTRIVLSIAGTSAQHCGYFNSLCANDSMRMVFVKNLVDLVEKEGFDGIDIDWESADSNNLVDATKMNNLMKDLREEFDKRTGDKSKYLLTCAVPASSWGAAPTRFDFKTLNSYVDYVNMMSYDLNKEDRCSHVSNLYTSSYDNGYKFSADYGVDLYTKSGLNKNKIIIGTAGYGKAYKVTGAGSNSKYPGLGATGTLTKINGITGSYQSGTIYYNGVLELLNNAKYVKYTEKNASGQHVGAYLYNSEDNIFVAYEDTETMRLKVAYAKKGGMGVMIWSYCEDGSGELVETIAKYI